MTWHLIDDACWLKIGRDGRDHIALRLAYAPGDQLSIGKIRQTESEIRFTVHAAIGTYSIRGFLPEGELPAMDSTAETAAERSPKSSVDEVNLVGILAERRKRPRRKCA